MILKIIHVWIWGLFGVAVNLLASIHDPGSPNDFWIFLGIDLDDRLLLVALRIPSARRSGCSTCTLLSDRRGGDSGCSGKALEPQ